MAKKKTDSKTIMLEHSKAKVELFERYWSVFLNILNRVDFITKLYLFDLFAGEGMYENEGKGSPIVAMEAIRNVYNGNKKKCKDTDVTFNDNGESKIEPGVLKINRIKRFVSKIFKPKNVTINYKKEDYTVIVKEVIAKLNNIKNSERALVFIDPWGYKEIFVKDIQDILQNKKTELILFLPVSFMYRFAHKAFTEEEFPGGKPLKKFLESLFDNDIPKYDNVFQFIDAMKKQFRTKVPVRYVDTFTIQRDNSNHFCLFFFTDNETGFEKMLSTKWKMDEQHGNGFRIQDKNQLSLFGGTYYNSYPEDLKKLLTDKGALTNHDLRSFGLNEGFLPRHTNEVLVSLKNKDLIEINSLDGGKAGNFYISDKKRKVEIKLKK